MKLLKDALKIPNLLSFFRIYLIYPFYKHYVNATSVKDYRIAAAIVLISGLTDLLDGYIARKYDQITDLGKLLDPVADKLTQLAIAICLTATWGKPMEDLLTIFIVKEISLIVCDIILLRLGEVMDGSLWYGKIATGVFYAVTFLLIFKPDMNQRLAHALINITSAVLLLAFVMYTRWFILRFKAIRDEDHTHRTSSEVQKVKFF